MIKKFRLVLAAGLALSLAACAATPDVDLTPPPKKCDAKTTLEYGKCR